MNVQIDVCTDDGWQRYEAVVDPHAIDACYRLPRHHSRAQYWRNVTGLQIPDGQTLIWQIANEAR